MTETLALHRPELDPSDQVSLHEHEQNDQRYDAHRNGSHEQVRLTTLRAIEEQQSNRKGVFSLRTGHDQWPKHAAVCTYESDDA